jgi:hypothetical protein
MLAMHLSVSVTVGNGAERAVLLTHSTKEHMRTYCTVHTQVTIGDLSGELHRRKKDMATVILQSQRTAVERSNMRR